MFGQNMVSHALRKQLSAPRCEACSFRFMCFRRLTGTTIHYPRNITPLCTDNIPHAKVGGYLLWYLTTIVWPATPYDSFQGLQDLVILSCLLDFSESRCGYRRNAVALMFSNSAPVGCKVNTIQYNILYLTKVT